MKNIFLILFVGLFSIPICAQIDTAGTYNPNEKQKVSFKSKMLYKSLKSSNFKVKTFNNMINKPKRGTNKVCAQKMNKKLRFNERRIDGFYVLTVQSSNPTNRHIIYLHGGAYVAEAFTGHKKLIEKLVLDYNFKVTYIDYPLAPEHQARKVHSLVEKAFKEIGKAYENDEFYLLGDSAGGGLALAFLQTLRNKNTRPFPTKTVLLSPWLDTSMTNDEIENYREKDVLLPVEGLIQCAELYAGDLDLKDPLLSPIYGDLKNLSSIQVFVSSHELFYPDCLLLKEMMKSVPGTSIDLRVKPEMLHDWVVLPIRESNETIAEISEFYLKD